MKPTFLCGIDNRTYSSLCRLDYHNCIHHTEIRVNCKGFCPCKGKRENSFFHFIYTFKTFSCTCLDADISHQRKNQRQQERLKSFINKYKATLDKNNGKGSPVASNAIPRMDRYTFTPEDFKYENKHYKYIKYTKYNKVSAIRALIYSCR